MLFFGLGAYIFNRLDPRMAINELFSPVTLRVLSPLQVFLLLIVKFPLVVVSVGLPIPAGVFVPSKFPDWNLFIIDYLDRLLIGFLFWKIIWRTTQTCVW